MNLTPWPPSAGERDEQVDGMTHVVEMGTREQGSRRHAEDNGGEDEVLLRFGLGGDELLMM
jgi:hypothetical protein